ncbi:MAG: hypothetical protein AAGC68_13785 [Verrucomicrobiota bacterium]
MRFITIAVLFSNPWTTAVLFAQPVPPQKTIIPAGSEAAGQTLFVEKGCYQCHVAGELKTPVSDLEETLTIDLGGNEHAGWSRDDFAKAIMNPNHTVSPKYQKIMVILGDRLKAENSPMPGFNDQLIVSDLIHLATFLDSLSD